MASSFNADQFLQTRTTGKLDTTLPQCPAGEYRAVVDKLTAREQQVKKGDRSGETTTIMDIHWQILDERVQELLGMNKVLCRQSVFLDLTPEGQLDYGKGKNVGLGKVREALGQNNPEKEWFPNMLLGSMATVAVTQRPNDKDPETPFSEVSRIAPID